MKPILIITTLILIFIFSTGYALPAVLSRDRKSIDHLPKFTIEGDRFIYQNHERAESVIIDLTL